MKITDVTAYDENTMEKVRRALSDQGLPGHDQIDAINAMQNEGILFRERTTEPTGVGKGAVTTNGTGMVHRHGQHGWHQHDDAGYLEHQRPIDDEVGPMPVVKGHPAQLSDGYHTMEELYEHRRALTAALAAFYAAACPDPTRGAWRSKAHHPDDDPMFEGGYFIVGIEVETGPVTYHYKLTHWDDFAAVPELEHAPKWDGGSPDDSVIRLLGLARMVAGSRS